MADYILAHDLGTSGNKATLFSVKGELVASKTVAYNTFYEKTLWAEQDADTWWQAVCSSTKRLMAEHGIQAEEVKSVSFSGQMMGCLPVDKQGNPLRRSIIWADQRAQKEAALLEEKIEAKRFYKIVGHRNTASYGIQKAMWVKENQPDIYEQTYKFLNAKDYMVFRLTGKFYTDCSDANSMDCLNLAARAWSEEIIEASGVDYDKLPEIVESTFCVGKVTKQAAAETGLSTETKVIMGAGDGVAANVGAGAIAPGKAYCCMGTSAWVAGTSERPILDEDMRIVCWAHAVPGLYSPNGTMQYAGGSFSWLKNTICLDETRRSRELGCSPYDVMNKEAAKSTPGANGTVFLPYLLGERAPRWNPDARGVFYGMTPNTKRADMLRSVMEGIVMNLSICFDILRQQVSIEEVLLIGGSARSEIWQHAIADIFGTRVMVPKYLEEANSMGAAVIAGVGSGIYKDFSAIDRFVEVQKKVEMNPKNKEIYQSVAEKYNQLYHALESVF